MEILNAIFRWFYCLDIPDALLLLIIATGAFVFVNERYCGMLRWRWLVGVLLCCWICTAGYATLGTRNDTHMVQVNLEPFHSYREVWDGGNPEIYRSNFMNVVLFYPAGLLATSLLPRKWAGWRRCVPVVLVLAAMSAGIEFLQYHYALGRCEIDDVIHNTLGALLGSLAVLWVPPLLAFLKEKVKLK